MKTVLIADDDEDMSNVVRLFLESRNCRVITVTEGPQALEAAYRERPDVVLLDIMMPGMHGMAVCARLREDERTRDAKIFIVSAKAYVADRRQAENAGADGFIAKPFEVEELFSVLAPVIGR